MPAPIATAFVLAAGLGQRMRPLTDDRPKPLVALAGRALIDHALDGLAAAGITRAIVNVHYRADQLEAHVSQRQWPRIVISDERAQVLETGGGVVKALPLIGAAPFLIHNSDTVWIERGVSNIARLMAAFAPARMETLLLLARRETALGYDGRGDFTRDDEGRISRPVPGEPAPFVFAGVSIAKPESFAGRPEAPFSLNRVWDDAMARRAAFGLVLDGRWMHVGTPAAVIEAEAAIAADAAESPQP